MTGTGDALPASSNGHGSVYFISHSLPAGRTSLGQSLREVVEVWASVHVRVYPSAAGSALARHLRQGHRRRARGGYESQDAYSRRRG